MQDILLKRDHTAADARKRLLRYGIIIKGQKGWFEWQDTDNGSEGQRRRFPRR